MFNKRKKIQQLWYMRRGKNVQGPFPAGLISSFILLGRIKDTDELSSDKKTWRLVPDVPELKPEVEKTDLNDVDERERFLAARRWADERRLLDRRNVIHEDIKDQRTVSDRRESESPEILRHREVAGIATEQKNKAASTRILPMVILGTVLLMVFAVLLMKKPVTDVDKIDCGLPPSAGVVWNNCFMQGVSHDNVNLVGAEMKNMQLTGASFQGSQMAGVDLSYTELSIANLRNTDLTAAILKGVQLRGADLSNSTLDGADLSYSDLTGADLSGASINNTILDNAIWIDGRVCAPGSIGQCR